MSGMRMMLSAGCVDSRSARRRIRLSAAYSQLQSDYNPITVRLQSDNGAVQLVRRGFSITATRLVMAQNERGMKLTVRALNVQWFAGTVRALPGIAN